MDAHETITKNKASLRAKRVSIIINMCGIPRKEFCLRHNFGTTTLRQWERPKNGRGLTEKGAERLRKAAEKYGVRFTLPWLYDGVGDMPAYSQKQGANPTGNLPKKAPNQLISDELTLFRKNTLNPVIYIVKTNNHAPTFQQGDILGGSLKPLQAKKLDNNTLYLLETKNGDILLDRAKLIGNTLYVAEQFLISDRHNTQPTTNSITAYAEICRIWRKTRS